MYKYNLQKFIRIRSQLSELCTGFNTVRSVLDYASVTKHTSEYKRWKVDLLIDGVFCLGARVF